MYMNAQCMHILKLWAAAKEKNRYFFITVQWYSRFARFLLALGPSLSFSRDIEEESRVYFWWIGIEADNFDSLNWLKLWLMPGIKTEQLSCNIDCVQYKVAAGYFESFRQWQSTFRTLKGIEIQK